ncbi:MAG: hypothetical protein ACNA7V_01630 [Bacteroidales bacterium]
MGYFMLEITSSFVLMLRFHSAQAQKKQSGTCRTRLKILSAQNLQQQTSCAIQAGKASYHFFFQGFLTQCLAFRIAPQATAHGSLPCFAAKRI